MIFFEFIVDMKMEYIFDGCLDDVNVYRWVFSDYCGVLVVFYWCFVWIISGKVC